MATREMAGELASLWLACGFLLRHSASERPGLALVAGYPPTVVMPDWCVGGCYHEALVAYAMMQFGIWQFGRDEVVAHLRAAGDRWARGVEVAD